MVEAECYGRVSDPDTAQTTVVNSLAKSPDLEVGEDLSIVKDGPFRKRIRSESSTREEHECLSSSQRQANSERICGASSSTEQSEDLQPLDASACKQVHTEQIETKRKTNDYPWVFTSTWTQEKTQS